MSPVTPSATSPHDDAASAEWIQQVRACGSHFDERGLTEVEWLGATFLRHHLDLEGTNGLAVVQQTDLRPR